MGLLTFVISGIILAIAVTWWVLSALFMVYMLVLLGALLSGCIIRIYNYIFKK